MFQNIVLALDGSKGSDQGVPVSIALAQESGGRIVVVHIDEQMGVPGGGELAKDPIRSEAHAAVARQVESIRAEGVEVELQTQVIVSGGPAGAIHEIAQEIGADLIVAGTRGRTALAGLILGSVTHRLLHVAKVPVLVVPSPASA